ncbi:MAG TPA: hypothetical protein DDZ89_01925, partial [Clostridiales bacterium]|nr:hypothetical protein [Clostridiales bacterium]
TQELYSSMGKGEFKPEMVVLSKMLARDYAAKGDMNSARNVLSATAERLTIAGQFSQAARLLRDADPETFIMTIDKQLKKLNEQGEKQYGKKWTPIDLLPEELDTIKAIPKGDEVAYQETWKKIGQRIAQQLPSTNMEKFDAWRRIAMLFNPRTHVRNIGGNLLMSGMQRASDIVGATIEGVFLPKEQRTKSFGWKSDSNLVQKVNEAWQADKETLTNQSRYEINNLKALGQDKRIFKSNALQGLNDITMQGLNLGDIPFVQAAYKNSLGQFMKARGLTEVTQEAKDYAKRRALEATFKETNEMATIINRLKQKPVVGKIIEGAIPFSKTPANITMRAIDYSPGGLLKALYDAKTGKTAVKTIEDLSKGLTGTAIMALGVWLSKIGWARVERDRSEKAEGLYQEMGRQSNSIITPKGSYTFDWAQPFAVPLAIGVTVGETMSKREDGDSLTSALIEGLYAGGDTIFNMTMLRNIKDIFGSGGSPTKKILSIPVSYIEQAIPAIFGQAARTIDPVRRSTYDPDPMRQEWNRIKSRVPFASKSLEPYLNIWGEEQQQGGAVEQFISPGYWNSQSGDRVTNEIMRVHKATGDNSILPKIAFNFQLDGKTVSLPSDLMTEFQREMGQRNHSDLLALIGSSRYQKADDESRGKLIREVVEKNYNDVKKNIIKEYKLIQASAFKQ